MSASRSGIRWVVLLIVLSLFWYLLADHFTPYTQQARVEAFVIPVAPEVSGRVTRVYVRNNQDVKAGAILFEVDPEHYRIAVDRARADPESTRRQVGAGTAGIESARASLRAAQANELKARQDSGRLERLYREPAGYLPVITKSVSLGQQSCTAAARGAARELLGSTRRAPSFWLNTLVTSIILLSQSVQDSVAGKDVYKAFAVRMGFFIAVTLYACLVLQLLDQRSRESRRSAAFESAIKGDQAKTMSDIKTEVATGSVWRFNLGIGIFILAFALWLLIPLAALLETPRYANCSADGRELCRQQGSAADLRRAYGQSGFPVVRRDRFRPIENDSHPVPPSAPPGTPWGC